MKTYIGIDVSKHDLQIDQPGKAHILPNTPEAITTWLATLPPQTHLIFEPSGGYEKSLQTHAHAEGRTLTLVNPRYARDFARSLGALAKTDAIDARHLRLFGEKLTPAATTVPEPEQANLREYTSLRDDLAGQLQALKNREEHLTLAQTRRHLKTAIKQLEKQLAKLDHDIAQYLRDEAPAMEQRVQTLCLVPGVGERTATALVAHLRGLGQYTDAAIAKQAGLAPINHDSGQLRGRRHIAHGNAPARKVLYMAALVAARYNEWLKAVYLRLRANGKPPKVALIAVARKLLVYLNHLLKPAFQQPA
jgi:transposase